MLMYELHLHIEVRESRREIFRAVEDKANDFIWQSEVDGILIVNEINRWAEKHDSKSLEFYFQEKTVDYINLEVILEDTERSIELKLTRNAVYVKQGDPNKTFSLLYSGKWLKFSGKKVREKVQFSFEIDEKYLTPPSPIIETGANPSIAVLLAAYRDPLCGNSLFELFSNSKYPERITASVAQQNGPNDPDCLKEYCKLDQNCRKDQVTIVNVPLNKSRGVMPGRYHQLYGLRDEEFCLQVDAHSVFETQWDIIALEDWMLTENEMAVLTTYPNRAKDKHKQKYTPVRCSTKFSHQGQLVHGGNSAHNVRLSKKPYLQPFFGAGVAFSKCHANWNVPYDPYMSFLFGGEEFNRAARLFTWGYDLYSPRRNFVYHYYDDDLKDKAVHKPDTIKMKKRNRDFFTDKDHLGSQTTLRWRKVFGLPTKESIKELLTIDLDLFGLGTRRSLEDFLTFAKVDFEKSETTSLCDMIGKLNRVPYEYQLPFNPNGPSSSCRSLASKCCNALKLSRVNANWFLDKTTKEVNSIIKTSRISSKVLDEPNISPFADGLLGYPGECDNSLLKERELVQDIFQL